MQKYIRYMINIKQGILLNIKHVYTYTTKETTERTLNNGLLTYLFMNTPHIDSFRYDCTLCRRSISVVYCTWPVTKMTCLHKKRAMALLEKCLSERSIWNTWCPSHVLCVRMLHTLSETTNRGPIGRGKRVANDLLAGVVPSCIPQCSWKPYRNATHQQALNAAAVEDSQQFPLWLLLLRILRKWSLPTHSPLMQMGCSSDFLFLKSTITSFVLEVLSAVQVYITR